MERKRVVITGIGTINPLGRNVEEYFSALENGVCGVDIIHGFDCTTTKTKFAAEIKNYNAEEYFERKEAKKLDVFTQYALIAADEAVRDAGLEEATINKDRVGVIWGAGIGGINTTYEEVAAYSTSESENPRFTPS